METKVKVKFERDGKIFYTIRSRYVFNAIMMDKGVCLEFLSDATKLALRLWLVLVKCPCIASSKLAFAR